jgi:hypothetical protein
MQKAQQQAQQANIPEQLRNPQSVQQQTPAQNVFNQQQRTYIPSSQGVQILENGKSPSNLLNKYNGQNVNTTNTTSITNTTNTISQKSNEPLRNYIPSPVGVRLNQGEDVTNAEKAMRKADLAEQQALQTLKMN